MYKKFYNSYAVIIQARLNSMRLKNKILKKIHKNLTILDFFNHKIVEGF